MKKPCIVVIVFAVLVAAMLAQWRALDHRADAAVWARLLAQQPTNPLRFDPSMVADLPDPAQRYFLFAIKTGTPLLTVAEVSMQGQFSLGSKANPNYMPMRAEQILAPPHGFVWKPEVGDGLTLLSGSDVAEIAAVGTSWSRFWLLDFLPVARAGGNPDHLRSAFGRYVAEAVFWSPAALLPGEHIRWAPIDASSARVTVTYQGLQQAVDIFVDADGKLNKIVFLRWSDANPARQFQLQSFGGYVSGYKAFAGFSLPTKIEAGNFFATDAYFPFFKVSVTGVRYPTVSGE